MSKEAITGLIIQGAVALGTLLAVVVAIWGNWIRAWLAPSKLSLKEHNFRGTLTTRRNRKRVIYYHLKVTNNRHWAPCRNCQVLLKGLSKRGPDGTFQSLELPVPLQFVWSPQGFTPAFPTVYKDQVIDLGFIDEDSDKFIPALYTYTNNFKGMVGNNETIRYHLEVVGDICPPSKPAVVEVAWDGEWSSDMDEMSRHLIIKFI